MFRFTIRDMLWLMVVVGLAIMWQADRRRVIRLEDAQLRLTERLAKAETQIADYQAKLQDELTWEASRRAPNSLLYFPPPSKAGNPPERASEAIRRIESILQSRVDPFSEPAARSAVPIDPNADPFAEP